MKRFIPFLGVLILLTLCLSCGDPDTYETPYPGSYSGRILFFHGLDETIALFDPAEDTLYPNIVPTESAPNHLLFWKDSLFVTNSLSNSIQKFSYDSEKGLIYQGRLFLGANKNPWMIIPVDPQGRDPRGFVPCYLSGEIVIVNLEDFTLGERVIPAGRNPQGGAASEGRLYVGNVGFNGWTSDPFDPGTLTVVDLYSEAVVDTIVLADAYNPQMILPFPSLGEIHVVCTGSQGANDGTIVILSDTSYQESTRLPLGGSPSWAEGGIDPVGKIVYLSGVGGLQAYKYESREILGEDSGQGWYSYKGGDAIEDLWSGVFYDTRYDALYVCRSAEDKLIRLRKDSSGGWREQGVWDTYNYPQGNFILLP
ncbi:MAG: hypothetical protein JW760_05135 [Spirochaetales bacterium]|nr:hypothetical protein [Spirochaetales bacterium]